MPTRTFIVSEINGESVIDWDVTLDIKGAKKYILVAGIDYHTGNSFMQQLDIYKNKIISDNKDKGDTTIIIIDFNGTIDTIDNGKSISIEKYTPISKSNYPASKGGHAFDALGKSKYITKKTIYEVVEKIGKDDPNTLQEVSIFSHSYSRGPILANSSEKDAIDLDMRINDVAKQTFDFTLFKKAFSVDGIFKIWGCNMDSELNNITKQILNNPL